MILCQPTTETTQGPAPATLHLHHHPRPMDLQAHLHRQATAHLVHHHLLSLLLVRHLHHMVRPVRRRLHLALPVHPHHTALQARLQPLLDLQALQTLATVHLTRNHLLTLQWTPTVLRRLIQPTPRPPPLVATATPKPTTSQSTTSLRSTSVSAGPTTSRGLSPTWPTMAPPPPWPPPARPT